MNRRTLKVDTEKFVRTALANSSDEKPSEQKIQKAVGEIIRVVEPVISRYKKSTNK